MIWLNEAQHYLGARQGLGEQIAATLRTRLADRERAPILVVGTLWPEYARTFTALPQPGQPDPHSQARALLAGCRLELPDHFDTAAITSATHLAASGDQQLSQALQQARDGRLAQFLAGAAELLHRYRTASPAAGAVLRAAMDARRLGVGPHLSAQFLAHAAEDYLGDDDFDALADRWFAQVLAETGEAVHGNLAPLRNVRPRPAHRTPAPRTPATSSNNSYRLADYLEQHGRHDRQALCPPASFWEAAHTHLTRPDDLIRLAEQAERRLRNRWAEALYQRAADAGVISAWQHLYELRLVAGDEDGAQASLLRAVQVGSTDAMSRLAQIRLGEGDRTTAEAYIRQAANAGSVFALRQLAALQEDAGAYQEAEVIYRRAAGDGDIIATEQLVELLERTGQPDAAEQVASQAATAGDPDLLTRLALIRQKTGDHQGARTLARQAAEDGDRDPLLRLAYACNASGDRAGAESLAQESAAAGSIDALAWLAAARLHTGEIQEAERLYQQLLLTPQGHDAALQGLATLNEMRGDRQRAEDFAWRAADRGNIYALCELAHMREGTGNLEGAEDLYRRCIDAGHDHPVIYLVELLERAGRHDEATALASETADAGDGYALVNLAEIRQSTAAEEYSPVLQHEPATDGVLPTST
ncbi:transcriptional regulator [Streptomyces sp. NPDC049970]|uniref:tetratricopeptide repeat protein n=1 Tax=Streptomyces sp. NPDC049970 TaxID=3155033 RepID=UPI00341396C7